MKRISFIGIIFWFCLFIPLGALTKYDMVSDYVGTSAKMIALGNIEGFDNSGGAAFENPAALCLTPKISLASFTTTLMDEVNYLNYGMTTRTDFGNFGFGYMQATVSDIKLTTRDNADSPVYATGSFDSKTMLARLNYQNLLLTDLYYGFALNYYATDIYNINGKGYNADVGLFCDLKQIQVSAALKNMFSRNVIYNNDTQEAIPRYFYFSTKYAYSQELKFYAQLKATIEPNFLNKACALSYKPENEGSFLSFYLSYHDFYILSNLKSNVAVGVGLELDYLNFYVAYEKSDYYQQDNKIYFSMDLNFK